LSRKPGEAVTMVIPPCPTERTVRVSVQEVGTANKVRLGFEAEREIEIYRDELLPEVVA
jgi:sRNA-binding carbon storage regulator CsrA